MKSTSQATTRSFLSVIEWKLQFTLAILIVLAAVPAAFAATDTWNGASSTSAFWNDGLNWVATTAPNTNDTLIFDLTFQPNNTNNLTANAPLGGLTFAATAGAFVLNGNAIAPSNSPAVTIEDDSSSPETVNLNVAPLTGTIFNVGSAGGNLIIGGVVSGARNLSQTGPGTLTFTNVNTFTGPIGGIAGTLAIGGAGRFNNGIYAGVITNNGTFAYNSSALQTNTGVLSGTGALVVNGPGTLTLGALNTFTGGTTVNGGILQLTNGGGTAAILGTLNINPGGRVNALFTDDLGFTSPALSLGVMNIVGGTFNIGVNGNEGFYTVVNLTGGTISSTGGGALNTTTNINTFATNIVSTISANVVYRQTNVTYTVAAGTVPGGIDLAASGVHSINGGNGVIVKTGAGTMAMSGTNTFNGGIIVSNGVFVVNGAGLLNSGNFSGFITNYSTISFNSSASQTLSGTIANSGSIVFNNAAADAISGIVGTGTITQNGSGSLSVSGVNTYTGATTVNAGELIGVTGGSISSSVVTIGAGATNGVQLASAGGQFTTTNLIFNAGTTYLDFNFANNALSSSSAPLNVNGNLTLGGTLNIIIRNTFGIPTSQFPLIKYSGTLSGTPPSTVFSLPSGVVATISNNVANQSIDLVVSVGNQITWAAGSGAWNFSTPNWISGITPVNYADGNFVVFEDTKSGAGPITVALNTTVSPANAHFNNSSKSYTISGSGSIAGAASLIKDGTNILTLANNNTYTNSTTLNAGTTVLNFTGGATNIISTNSALVLGGGTLQTIGSSSSASSQTFASTTLNPGNSVITAASVSGANLPTNALGNLAANYGATVVFNGPATIGAGATPVAPTAVITMTNVGGSTFGLIYGEGSFTSAPYATVGLYDWASTSLTDGTAGTSPYTIIGGSQVPGFYTSTFAFGNNYDVTANAVTIVNNTGLSSIRFDNPSATTLVGAGANLIYNSVLVTPDMGANNTAITGAGTWQVQRSGNNGPQVGIVIQNNTLGYFTMSQRFDNGRNPTAALPGIPVGYQNPNSFIKSGDGTAFWTGNNATYIGQTYVNGGNLVITADNAIGLAVSNTVLNLNGGALVGNASFSLDNGSPAVARPISLLGNGGGLAATSNSVMTVDGVIGGVAGTGPLWIGIPSSSANGNTLGLLPGSGPNTANPTPVYAVGVVNLSGANTYTGGTILYSGILNFIPGSLGIGGVTLAGGTLQWASGNTADISTKSISIVSPGGVLDANGNTVTLANPIGAGGNGTLTLASSSPNSVLNLNGANTYTGGTTISNNTLVNLNNSTGSATGSGTVTVQGSSASTSASLSGGGIIAGNLTVSSGGIVAPGNGVGTLTVGSLTINSGSTFNYEFNSTPTNDLIVSGGLTINDTSHNAAFNLFQAGTTSPLTAGGTYNLVKFTGSIGGATGLDSSWTTANGVNPHIGNPQVGSLYSFGNSGGYLTVTITIDPTVTIGVWNVDANGNWSDSTKWSSSPLVPGTPGPGDSATFGAGSVFRTVTMNTAQSVGGIRFTNNNSFLIADAGQTLTLNNKGGTAPIYVTAGKSNVIQTAVALSDNALLNVGSGSSLALSGTVGNTSSTKTLTINSAGTVALSGNNSYGPAAGSFGTTLASGTLQLGNNNALGAGDVAVTGISTIVAGAPVSVANNIDVASGVIATITNAAANSLTLGGVISDSGALVKTGNGIVTLANNNTYTGGIKVNGGTVSISQDANLGSVTKVVLNGGGLLANATTSLDPSRNIGIGLPSGTATSTGFLDAASGQILTVAGTIDSLGNIGTNNLTVNSLSGSTGTVLLSAANTFNGTTLVGNGILDLQNSLALQNSTLNYSGSGSLVFDNISAATLGALNGSNNISLLNLSSSPVALTVGGNNASTVYYGNLTDGGAGATLVKNGNGTFTLKGTNSYTGTTTVNAGTLEITNAGVLTSGALSGQGFLVDGGTLTTPPGIINNFNTAGATVFRESSGTVNVDTFQTRNNDGMLVAITGGSFSANLFTLQRTIGNTTAPTATAPIAAQTTSGLYINGTNANVNLGALTIGLAGANSSATARLDAGLLTVTNEILIGNVAGGRWNVLQVNGGLLNSLDTVNGIVIGPNQGANTQDSELYLSGGTTLANIIAFGAATDTAGGTGWMFITGGNLYVGSGGISKPNTAGMASTIVLTSGLMGALADWTNTLPVQMNGTSFTFKAADTNNVAHNITMNGVVSGAGALNKIGNGTLTLTATNTYTGNTIISNGTLVATAVNPIGTSANIIVSRGAALDVSASPFVLGGSQTLQGGGTNNGSVNTTLGSLIYAGTDGTYGTNTFNNNLSLVVGAAVNLDLSTNFNGSNDLVNVGGNLTLNGNNLNLKAQSTSANLDTNNDYVLFNVAGTISGSFASTPVWGVQPANASRFNIVTDPVNKQVRLHAYGPGVNPPTGFGTATPSTVYGNQNVLITVTVTPGTSAISTVVMDASLYGGPSSVPLVLSGVANVYTNTVTIPSVPLTGNKLLAATITDAANNKGVALIAMSVQAGRYWVGGAGDANWSSGANWLGGTAPLLSGDSVTFAGVIKPVPNMENNYSIAALNFDPTATSFTLNTVSGTLTLNGGVTNNSPSVQTLNLPVVFNGAQTINTASNNVTISGVISDGTPAGAFFKSGTNTLTLTTNNTFTGGVTVNATSGTLALLADFAGGNAGLIAVNSASSLLLGTPNAAAANTLRLNNGSTLKLRADSDTTFATGTITAPSATGTISIDVNNLTTGVTNHTLTLSSALAFSNSSDQTLNVTGGNGYTLSLPNITATTTTHTPYINMNINSVPGINIVIGLFTAGSFGSNLNLQGGGNISIVQGITAAPNGSTILYVQGGTTVTFLGTTILEVAPPTADGYSYYVQNGALVVDNNSALVNNQTANGTPPFFILGMVNNTNAATAGFNAAVYLGDTNFPAGGISVDPSVTNYVADGGVTNPNTGTFIIGGQNTSGVNYYGNPIILGFTNNLGKSITLAAATGGEVDFTGGILRHGTDTTAGVTIGNGANFAGIIGFQAANTYVGATIISNGTLALSGSGSIANSTSINISAGATFDVTALGGFTLNSPQTLKGNGTVNGSLTTLAGSTVAPGASVGTLTVNGNVTLGGTLAMELNRTNTPSNCDHLNATGTIAYGGPLTVTNIGPTLQVNDTFQLFSSGVSGFTTVNIATNDANKVIYTWENDLATLGSVKVLTVTPLVNTNAATANFKAIAVSGSLQFTWAPDHLGWQLYTNSVGLTASSSWFPVPGSAAVTNETITINPAKTNVFFQLRYP